MFISVGANIFTAAFFGIGGNKVMSNFIIGLGLGKVGIMISVMILVFILGMLMDWIGILLIVIPIFLPILTEVGFEPLWASMMIIVLLQTSFLTPPFAYSLFYIRAVAPPEVTSGEIYKGVVPFIAIIWFVLGLLAIFPGIISWLPNLMTSLAA
jgi:TRAP-type mannitol/chloroaromatic compound transport system permease large subunit